MVKTKKQVQNVSSDTKLLQITEHFSIAEETHYLDQVQRITGKTLINLKYDQQHHRKNFDK